MNKRYLIIADDFTGANDTGVQLRRRGFPTEVIFAGKVPDAEKSTVIDTESRAVHPDQAYETVYGSLKNLDFRDYQYVIKKIDSTMRGNIAAEIKAVDEAYRPEMMVFAPAFPDLGRTTVDGVQRLNGVEICKTELSRDPKNPVVEDNLVRLLSHIYEEQIVLKRLPAVKSASFGLSDGRIFVCDADSNEDLTKICLSAKQSGKRVLYIGTAGIADALMQLENPSMPAFGVAASVSAVTNMQMRYCEQSGITMVMLPVCRILSGEEDPEHYKNQALSALKQGKDTILLTDSAYDRGNVELSLEMGERMGMTSAETSDKVRRLVGRLAKEILEEAAVSGVFLTGGDTALGMMDCIEAEGAEIMQEILVGIPMVKVRGKNFDGMKLVTKAGAFGSEDAVAFAMRKLKEII